MNFAKEKSAESHKKEEQEALVKEALEKESKLEKIGETEAQLQKMGEFYNQHQVGERKNILTSAVQIAGVTLGVTALAAKEVVHAIKDPKAEFEKVQKLTTKAVKKIDYAVSNPEAAAKSVARVSKVVSKGIITEVTEVTKGTINTGKDTVGMVAGFIQGEDSDSDDDDLASSRAKEYNSLEMSSRKIQTSLLDRVGNVCETTNGHSRPKEAGVKVRRRMPHKLGSQMLRGSGATMGTTWEP